MTWSAKSPSSLHSRQQVTFEDSLTIGADDSCPLSWADEMAQSDHSDWSQLEPEDLESPPTLDPQVQEFLTREGMPLASYRSKEDSYQSKTPEPSLEDSNKWILWCAHQVETLSWWPELWEVPNEMDIPHLQGGCGHHFRCWRQGVMPQTLKMTSVAPTPHCIEWDAFLPFNKLQFSGQDYCMKQPQKTLAYTKALQHWAEKAQPPTPGKAHQLAECVQELREAMEPLTTFTDAEVFGDDVPLHWVKITSSRTSEPAEPTTSQEWSCSQNRRAHTQGSFAVAHNVGRSKPVTSTQMASPSHPHPTIIRCPPGFAEITQSLSEDNPPHVAVEVPQELTEGQGPLAGTAMAMMISTWLCQDMTSGITYVDMVTCSMSLVGLGATPAAVEHAMPALEGWEDTDSD